MFFIADLRVIEWAVSTESGRNARPAEKKYLARSFVEIGSSSARDLTISVAACAWDSRASTPSALMHATIREGHPHHLLLSRRQRRRHGRALFSEKLSTLTHKPVIVDKGGAFGNIGTEAAAKSRPDGYTC
jgi:hypothetical protein